MKLFIYFIIFFIAHSIVQSYMYWVTRNTESLSLFNMNFSSVWTFWLCAVLIATPFLTLANLSFGATFYFGYKDYSSAWLILITYVGAQTLAVPFMIYLWFQEIPQKGPLLGAFLCLAGILVANFWKD